MFARYGVILLEYLLLVVVLFTIDGCHAEHFSRNAVQGWKLARRPYQIKVTFQSEALKQKK